MRWFLCVVSCCAMLAAGCAGVHRSSAGEWGWFGASAELHMAGDDWDWGFSLDGDDLVLRNDSRKVVLTGFSSRDGVRYRILDGEEPHVLFRSTTGEEAEWEGNTVERGDALIRLVE